MYLCPLLPAHTSLYARVCDVHTLTHTHSPAFQGQPQAGEEEEEVLTGL